MFVQAPPGSFDLLARAVCVETNKTKSQCTIDHNTWAKEIGDYFSCKWKAKEGHNVQDLLVAGESQKLGLQGTDMLDLFSSIKNQCKMDANGVSVYALRFVCVASPTVCKLLGVVAHPD